MQVMMLCTYIFLVFSIFDSSSCWYQNDIANQQILGASFTRFGDTRVFEDINDFSAVWDWFEGPVMENIYKEHLDTSDRNHEAPSSLLYNKYFHMIGTVQIRQIRVKGRHETFNGESYTIWPDHLPDVEDDRRPLDIWHADLAQYVKHPKYDKTLLPLPQLKGNPRLTKKGNYGTSGYIIDLDSDYNRTREVVKQLKQHQFLDAGTRIVLVEVNFFNPNQDIITILHSKVEFFASGWVNTHSLIKSAPRLMFERTMSLKRNVLMGIFGIFLMWRIYSVVRKAWEQRKRGLRGLLTFAYLVELANTTVYIGIITGFVLTMKAWKPDLALKDQHQVKGIIEIHSSQYTAKKEVGKNKQKN
jgi:hypothetical protein